jgi:hypothetical protein
MQLIGLSRHNNYLISNISHINNRCINEGEPNYISFLENKSTSPPQLVSETTAVQIQQILQNKRQEKGTYLREEAEM